MLEKHKLHALDLIGDPFGVGDCDTVSIDTSLLRLPLLPLSPPVHSPSSHPSHCLSVNLMLPVHFWLFQVLRYWSEELSSDVNRLTKGKPDLELEMPVGVACGEHMARAKREVGSLINS